MHQRACVSSEDQAAFTGCCLVVLISSSAEKRWLRITRATSTLVFFSCVCMCVSLFPSFCLVWCNSGQLSPAWSCRVSSCLVLCCPVLSCFVSSCFVLFCLVSSCHVLSRLMLSCLVLSCFVLFCLSCFVFLSLWLSVDLFLCFCNLCNPSSNGWIQLEFSTCRDEQNSSATCQVVTVCAECHFVISISTITAVLVTLPWPKFQDRFCMNFCNICKYSETKKSKKGSSVFCSLLARCVAHC